MTYPSEPANSGYPTRPNRLRRWLPVLAVAAVLASAAAAATFFVAPRPAGLASPLAAPAVTSASASPSLARLDMKATCAVAVPALLAATELLQAFADAGDDRKKLRALDAEKFQRSAADLRAIVAVAAPAVAPLIQTTATAVGGVARLLRSGGTLQTDWDAIRAAGTGVAEACRPYAGR